MARMRKTLMINTGTLIGYAIAILMISMLILPILTLAKSSPSPTGNEKYLTKSMYKILGMLNEYQGLSMILGSPPTEYIASFSEDEKDLANDFDQYLQAYKKEIKHDFQYSRTQEGMSFKSTELCRIVYSFFIRGEGYTTLDSSVVIRASQENKLNYIESVYRRFGEDKKNSIFMANSFPKIKTVALVLKELGCPTVIIYAGEFEIPTVDKIIFEPSKIIKERLQLRQYITEKDMQREESFRLYKKL